jgi:hypothetical protein
MHPQYKGIMYWTDTGTSRFDTGILLRNQCFGSVFLLNGSGFRNFSCTVQYKDSDPFPNTDPDSWFLNHHLYLLYKMTKNTQEK